MASEFVTLVESIGDPTLTVGLLCAAAQAKFEAGELIECLQMTQRVIDLAGGDPAMGNIMVGSPLAWAITLRGTANMCLGRDGWRKDLEEGIALALPFDVTSRCNSGLYKYVLAAQNGAVIPDEAGLTQTAEWLETAEQSGDDAAMALTRLMHAITLIHHSSEQREAGVGILVKAHDAIAWLSAGLRRFADIELARHRASVGDLDGAIAMTRTLLDEQFSTGEMISRGAATTVLVEALLLRRGGADLHEAQTAIDRLAAVPTDPGFVMHELPLLRLRAMVALASGDEAAYRDYINRYRQRALACGFEGHIATADAMSLS